MVGAGKSVGFSFESGGIPVDEIARLAADMWADLPFDRDVLSALKRDGLVLDQMNLGGPCPYLLTEFESGSIGVDAAGPEAETLLDLWRMHFMRGLRPRTLAA